MRTTITPKLNIWGRILTAFPIGYAVTSLAVMAIARLLPLPPIQASVTAGLVAFPIYAALIVYIFAAPNFARAFLVTFAISAVCAVIVCASMLLEGRL